MRCLAVCALAMAAMLAACGGDQARPVARMDVRDLRESQAREGAPGPQLLEPMRDPEGPGRILYEPPTDLSLRRNDSLVTPPSGITAPPDTARRSAAAPAPARRDSAR
jgi:hypothetical protein